MKQFLLLFACTVFTVRLCAQITYPGNMYPDSHAPFVYGVASGDPLPHAVVVWTAVDVTDSATVAAGQWSVATDSLFQNVVASGAYSTDSSADFTVNVDVTGLNPGTVYYYRFVDAQNHFSMVGRTKTASTGNLTELNMAVMSCSSIFSGYFNAYRRLGERDVLDAVIHLGDYIYDFVDEDEQVRVPAPYPQEPANLQEWRARHRYYLMDPDLRLARSQHPWIALWDNHDRGGDHNMASGDHAFREYLPIRKNARTDNDSIFRRFTFGNLVDIWVTDVGSYRDVDTLPGGDNLMGNVQLNEFIDGLKTSAARWKIMGSQKMTGGWYTTGIDPTLLAWVPNNGPVFDNSSWDGYPQTRNRIFDSLRVNHIDNFVALSGDAHISMAMDLVSDPHDSLQYNAATGQGSVGVEFLPSSISRGNLDEGGVPTFAIPAFVDISMGANPQHVYMDGVQHGYGLLQIRPDSMAATFCYSPILEITETETYKTMLVRNGENHWVRSVSQAAMEEQPGFFPVSAPYPNPTRESICLDFGSVPPTSLQLNIICVGTGRTVYAAKMLSQHVKTSVQGWGKGLYVIQLVNGNRTKYFKFVVQ